MDRLVAIFFLSSLLTAGYSQKESTTISKYIMQSTFNPLLEVIWRHEEMATRFIERKFNTTILPHENEDATNNDVINSISELKDEISNLKDLTLFISDKNDAKEVFGEIESALRSIADIFKKTINAKGHFINNTIERPSMYEHRFINALQSCLTNFNALYNKIIDKKLVFQYALPGFSSSLKTLGDVCKIGKTQDMEIANVIGIIKTAIAQIYVTLKVSSAMADTFHKTDNIGSYAASFQIEWDNIKPNYQELVQKLKSDMKNASHAYWSCRHPKNDPYSKLRKQQYYHINTRASMANWTSHFVVIGAKFELVDDTFNLRIQQGRLLPNGSIDPGTISWESGNRFASDKVKISKSYGRPDIKAFDLTEVKLPQGRVVIGLGIVKIQESNNKYDNRIGLAAYSAKIDFEKGMLWRDSSSKRLHRPKAGSEKLLLYKQKQKDSVFTKGNQYVLIDECDEKSERNEEISSEKQVIPLLNTEELTQKHEMPLSGAGLFLSRLPSESENIVGIKLFTYDLSPYVNTDVY